MMKSIQWICLSTAVMVCLFCTNVLWASTPERLPLGVSRMANQAGLLMAQKKVNEAVSFLEKAVAKPHAHYYLHFILGNALLMDPPDTQAKAAEKESAQDPKKVVSPVPGRRDRITRAARAFTKALEQKPDMSSAWFNLARCRYELEALAPAGQAFARAYETAPEKKAETLYFSAACYSAAGQFERAMAQFQGLIRDHGPEMKLPWKEALVHVFFSLERYEGALPWIEELTRITRGKKQKKWREILLQQYLALEMMDKALDYALFLTREDTLEPKWWKSLAHIRLTRFQAGGGQHRSGPRQALTALVVYGYLTPLTPDETRLLADLYSACNIPLRAARAWADWVATREATLGDVGVTAEGVADDGKQGENPWEQVLERYHTIALAHLSSGDLQGAQDWVERGLKHPRARAPEAGKKLRELDDVLATMARYRTL